MKDFNDGIYAILTKAEADGALGASVTANQIIELAKAKYKKANEAEKKEILQKFESLKKEPGVAFPEDYRAQLVE